MWLIALESRWRRLIRNLSGRGRWIVLLLFVLPWTVPAHAGQPGQTSPAQVDSLVWYVQQLEHDLSISRIRGQARGDSLSVRLEYVTEQLRWANEDRRRWYQSPSLLLLVGVAAGIGVTAAVLRVSY